MHSKSLYLSFKELLPEKKFKIIFGVLLFFLVKELIVITYLNGDVSYIADGYSEANTTRGALYYVEKGFDEYYGLGDLCYSELHEGSGFRGKDIMLCREGSGIYVYTHYPNGSEYLAYPLTKLFGPNMWVLRLQPIFINFTVALCFMLLMFQLFPKEKAVWVCGVLLFPQMFHNYWHGLHHQGYAFSITLLQIILITKIWTQGKNSVLSYLGLIFLGFWHGWMTFDYAFIATFISLPLFFYFKDQYQLRWQQWFLVTFCCGIGFTAAHVIHFFQVIWYYGSYEQAAQDLFGSAQYRMNNNGALNHKIKSHSDLKPMSVVKDYMWRVAGRFKYTSVNLINYVWIVLGLKFVKRVDLKIKNLKFEFNISRSDVFAILASILVSGLWSMVMRQHAYIHGFIARHYYFVYLFCTLVLFRGAKKIKD